MKIITNYCFTAINLFEMLLITKRTYLKCLFVNNIKLGKNCKFGKNVRIETTDGGSIEIGNNVNIADRTDIQAKKGKIKIEDNVFIGRDSIIVSSENIEIGSETLIAEFAVIRDQDHKFETIPIRNAGFVTKQIKIGCNVWIGARVTVLLGSCIGDNSVIGAHSLVKTCLPSNCLAYGTPVKIKSIFR